MISLYCDSIFCSHAQSALLHVACGWLLVGLVWRAVRSLIGGAR